MRNPKTKSDAGELVVEVGSPDPVVTQLAAFFNRNGYVRRVNAERRAAEPRSYKKGDEVRLVAESAKELRTIRRLLRTAGFRPGRAFRKDKQWRQPIYGRSIVTQFLALIGADADG
jgi:hypothetical protein